MYTPTGCVRGLFPHLLTTYAFCFPEGPHSECTEMESQSSFQLHFPDGQGWQTPSQVVFHLSSLTMFTHCTSPVMIRWILLRFSFSGSFCILDRKPLSSVSLAKGFPLFSRLSVCLVIIFPCSADAFLLHVSLLVNSWHSFLSLWGHSQDHLPCACIEVVCLGCLEQLCGFRSYFKDFLSTLSGFCTRWDVCFKFYSSTGGSLFSQL